MRRQIVLISVVAFALVFALPTAAFAKKRPASATGYDVSYPQCNGPLPASPLFGIVGVNNGIVYSANPCLAGEYAWASRSTTTHRPKVSFYANTANPGPTSSHWPVGQTSPRPCPAPLLTADCSYDYGWDAAADSFRDAVNAAGSTAAQSAPWWLDIESANSWTVDAGDNIAAIQGALDYLAAAATGGTGIYTNATSWQSITGSSSAFSTYPSWVPGASNLAGAQANCSRSITGGVVVYAQYPSRGYDADYICA